MAPMGTVTFAVLLALAILPAWHIGPYEDDAFVEATHPSRASLIVQVQSTRSLEPDSKLHCCFYRCDAPCHELDRGEEEPGSCAFDGSLEVLGQSAVAAEPGEGSFDHPAARKHLEALCGIGALDDLDSPPADFSSTALSFSPA